MSFGYGYCDLFLVSMIESQTLKRSAEVDRTPWYLSADLDDVRHSLDEIDDAGKSICSRIERDTKTLCVKGLKLVQSDTAALMKEDAADVSGKHLQWAQLDNVLVSRLRYLMKKIAENLKIINLI